MLSTLETRWFYPGSIPSEAFDWFVSIGEVESHQPRTDLYLLGTGEALGVKLREGQIEAKQRTARPEETDFGSVGCGLVEQWVKWSFAVEEVQMPALQTDTHWAAVEKTRWIYYYRLGAGGLVVPSSLDAQPKTGGGLELTALRLNGQQWWTIGVEVFGDENMLPGFLADVVNFCLPLSGIISLTCRNSFGYPHWLEMVE